MAKKINKATVDEEIILSCAFRYALGRMTYVVATVAQKLIDEKDRLSESFKYRTAKEIQEYQDEHGEAGMSFDNAQWNRVKCLFDRETHVTLEANKYQTDEWVEVDAYKGADGLYYPLDGGKGNYHTVRNVKKKVYDRKDE